LKEIRDIKESVARNLRYYREFKGLTQRELAEKLGTRHNTISAWESGTNSIDVAVLMQICETLDTSIDEMYYGKKNDSPIKGLSEREQYSVSLFRKLSDEEQLKIIGRLEAMTEG